MIRATERRRRSLSLDEWRLLESSEGFWRLVEAGYLAVRRSGPERYEIVGHKYVGRAVVGDVELEVDEKVPGTLMALIGTATESGLRILREEAPAGIFDLVSRHLMRQFTEAAASYIAMRRKPRYEYRQEQGPVLAGVLDISRTMRLHAAGRLGHFAFHHGHVVRDEPLDRLVLAGLEALDRAGEALRLEPKVLYEARWLASALAEVRDRRYLATDHESLLAIADSIQRSANHMPEDVDLARLAAIALLHRGFDPAVATDELVPRAWFVDLEALFEAAVGNTLQRLLDDLDVDRGERFPRRIFAGGSDSSRAYPDLVVYRGENVLAVGDVKYKSSSEGAGGGVGERPDLYQLLVHASTLDAGIAFLVYAGEEYRCSFPGVASTGASTWTAQVRPSHLAEDLEGLARQAGLGRPAQA